MEAPTQRGQVWPGVGGGGGRQGDSLTPGQGLALGPDSCSGAQGHPAAGSHNLHGSQPAIP